METVIGVGLDSSGRLVKGGGQSGVVGVVVLTKARKAGEVVDVMTDGEIVEMNLAGPRSPGPQTAVTAVPGTGWNSSAAGVCAPAAAAIPTSGARVGHMVETGRLVVRVDPKGAYV